MSTADKKLDDLVHAIAFKEISKGGPDGSYESNPLLAQLKSVGTELWIDTGDLELAQSIWKTELTALTTNNTLANQVVQSGVMDDVISETIDKLKDISSGLTEEELVMEIGFVINCRIALRLVEAFKVKVSVELHPSVSRDIEKSVEYGRRYFKVCPEFFTVKVPLTPEGLLAVRKLRKEGIPINFTLGFSARQNYLSARLSNPDFVNVFLGRLNAVVSDNSMGNGEMVGEKVTLATQRAVSELRQNKVNIQTRLIAASIRNGEQLATLAGLDVHTIPPKAMKEFLDSGREQVENNVASDPKPGIDADHLSRFEKLWEVPETFKVFVDSLVRHDQLDNLSGEELVSFCEEHDVDFFHRFSDADLKNIYDHGKIPRINDWPESVALDDLMTHSALQSFTKDQDALDERIRSFLK